MFHSNYLHAMPSAVELKLRTSPTSTKPKYSSISFADTEALSFEKKVFRALPRMQVQGATRVPERSEACTSLVR